MHCVHVRGQRRHAIQSRTLSAARRCLAAIDGPFEPLVAKVEAAALATVMAEMARTDTALSWLLSARLDRMPRLDEPGAARCGHDRMTRGRR